MFEKIFVENQKDLTQQTHFHTKVIMLNQESKLMYKERKPPDEYTWSSVGHNSAEFECIQQSGDAQSKMSKFRSSRHQETSGSRFKRKYSIEFSISSAAIG